MLAKELSGELDTQEQRALPTDYRNIFSICSKYRVTPTLLGTHDGHVMRNYCSGLANGELGAICCTFCIWSSMDALMDIAVILSIKQ